MSGGTDLSMKQAEAVLSETDNKNWVDGGGNTASTKTMKTTKLATGARTKTKEEIKQLGNTTIRQQIAKYNQLSKNLAPEKAENSKHQTGELVQPNPQELKSRKSTTTTNNKQKQQTQQRGSKKTQELEAKQQNKGRLMEMFKKIEAKQQTTEAMKSCAEQQKRVNLEERRAQQQTPTEDQHQTPTEETTGGKTKQEKQQQVKTKNNK